MRKVKVIQNPFSVPGNYSMEGGAHIIIYAEQCLANCITNSKFIMHNLTILSDLFSFFLPQKMETQQAKKRRKHTRTKQLENGSQSENSSACSDKCRPRSLTLQVVDDDFKDNDALNDGLED